MKSENKNTVKGGDTNITVGNSMSMPIKALIGVISAAALSTAGAFGGAAISAATDEAKLDKILTIVTKTQIKIGIIETEINNIKEDVKDNKFDIKTKQDKQ